MDDRLEVFFFDDPEEKRLDIFLVEVLPEFSRSRLQTLIRDGRVTVNGIPAKKSGQMLATGAEVRVVIPPPVSTTLTPEDIPLDVIFENEDVLVVNKPAGMVVHPSAGHETGTLVHAVLAHVPDLQGINGEVRPGVVHRLDKDTSGVIILAKNEKAIAFLKISSENAQRKRLISLWWTARRRLLRGAWKPLSGETPRIVNGWRFVRRGRDAMRQASIARWIPSRRILFLLYIR